MKAKSSISGEGGVDTETATRLSRSQPEQHGLPALGQGWCLLQYWIRHIIKSVQVLLWYGMFWKGCARILSQVFLKQGRELYSHTRSVDDIKKL